MRNLESEMLDALELFHYSYRFRNSIFSLILPNAGSLKSLNTDIQVLRSAHIRLVIFTQNDDTLQAASTNWDRLEAPYQYIEHLSANGLDQAIRRSLNGGKIPVVGLSDYKDKDLIFKTSARLSVEKVFLLSSHNGLIVDNVFYSHITPSDTERINAGTQINVGKEELQDLLLHHKQHSFEIVLLDDSAGSIFEEVFTHRGRGTLFSENYPNLVRRAEPKDAQAILLILRPYFKDGRIVELDDETITRSITDFFVYTVNRAIVATTRLIDFGDSAELAKFATLPRYQGKGRAKELALQMIEEAKKNGKKEVFALSVEEQMWKFFLQLGFSQVERETLPDQWKKSYNFARPSRAFSMKLNSPCSE